MIQMRGAVTIKSVTAKINKLEQMKVKHLKCIADIEEQLEVERIKKNELIAKIITSQVKDLDENILQKILSDYNKEVDDNETVPEKKSEPKATASVPVKEEKQQSLEKKPENQAETSSAPANIKEGNNNDSAPTGDKSGAPNDGEYHVNPGW